MGEGKLILKKKFLSLEKVGVKKSVCYTLPESTGLVSKLSPDPYLHASSIIKKLTIIFLTYETKTCFFLNLHGAPAQTYLSVLI